ncbi:hypothetical protein CsSME_00034249 [Camellia sinensis var. sinensis]
MAGDEVPIPDLAIGIGVALSADMEAEEAAALLPLAYRPFDMVTYQPHIHVPPFDGMLRFEGFIVGLDEDTLLREPTEHLSVDASTVVARRISGYRSISGPIHWYERLPVVVRIAVDAASFGPFCSGLIQMRAESWLCGALVDRWWDTIDSFHSLRPGR